MARTAPSGSKRLAPLLAGAVVIAGAAGCVQSEGRIRYEAHRRHVVAPGGDGGRDIALAFGLDVANRPEPALAAAVVEAPAVE